MTFDPMLYTDLALTIPRFMDLRDPNLEKCCLARIYQPNSIKTLTLVKQLKYLQFRQQLKTKLEFDLDWKVLLFFSSLGQGLINLYDVFFFNKVFFHRREGVTGALVLWYPNKKHKSFSQLMSIIDEGLYKEISKGSDVLHHLKKK